MADAWGGSWGSSWGVSWGTGDAPAPTVGAPSYGGSDYEKYWKRLAAAEKRLVEARQAPVAEQAEAVREVSKEIDAIESATEIEAPPFIVDLDGDYVRQQLESLRLSLTTLAQEMEAQDRRRRNNNWLMLN